MIKKIIAILIPILFILLFSLLKSNVIEFADTFIGKLTAITIILFYAEINIMYGFLALVFIIFFYKIFDDINNESINFNEPKNILVTKRRKKSSFINKVPLVIYQTWYTKDLPPKMKECVNKLISSNPEFEHHLYDDADCRQFIKDNFNKEILNSYDSLVPGAYKADLWRYCILYKNGGIYLDIKFECEQGFKLIEMANDDNFVLDRPYARINENIINELEIVNDNDYYNNIYKKIDINTWKNKRIGIYNAIISTKPNNPILLDCINQIIENIKNDYYGHNELYPTGPGLLSEKYFNKKDKQIIKEQMNQFTYFNSVNGNYIINKNRKILSQYPEYRNEQKTYGIKTNKYYSILWNEMSIYNKNILQ